MSRQSCPRTGITYVTIADYCDKFMMVSSMEVYVPYMSRLSPRRWQQLKSRFHRRATGVGL